MSQIPIATGDLETVSYSIPASSHLHVNCEFLLMTSGRAVNRVGTTEREITVGDVIFMNTRVPHALTDASPDQEHRDIYISEGRLKGLCDALFGDGFFDELEKTDRQIGIPLSAGEFRSIAERLSDLEMRRELAHSPAEQEICKKCVLSVILQLLGHYYEWLHTAQNPPPAWLTDFLRKVQSPELFSRQTEEVIALSGYSHTHFSMIFRENFHRSFKSYLTELRMNHAESMLRMTDASVLEVSLTVGYSSISHFIHCFKIKTGLTPQKYRALVRKTTGTEELPSVLLRKDDFYVSEALSDPAH